MNSIDKWTLYRKEYLKTFRIDNPYYWYDYYAEHKDKYEEYINKRKTQKQRIKEGLEPLPRIKRSKYELSKMREERQLKNLKLKAEQFKEILNVQNTC